MFPIRTSRTINVGSSGKPMVVNIYHHIRDNKRAASTKCSPSQKYAWTSQ